MVLNFSQKIRFELPTFTNRMFCYRVNYTDTVIYLQNKEMKRKKHLAIYANKIARIQLGLSTWTNECFLLKAAKEAALEATFELGKPSKVPQ